MGAIRLAPRDTSFETPAQFDPGLFDFYSTMAYDSLYQSPVAALYRGGTMAYEKNFGSENILDPDKAQEQYGLDGLLKFDEPITESAAQLMKDRKIAEIRREQIISGGFRHGGVGRGVTGFGVSLGASLLDPINIASMFIPVAGPTSRLTQAGMSIRKARLLTGAIEGAVGQAIVEPLILFPNIYEQSNYGFEDSLLNISAGTLLGSGLHFGVGEIGDKFSQITEAFKFSALDWKSPVDGRPLNPTEWAGIEEDTHKAIIQSTISELVQDQPVTGAGELVNLDKNVIMDQLRNDIFERSRPEIGEYYLRQSRLGYELLVDQIKNRGSRQGWDADRVRAEVEKELGSDFETKVRRELTGTEEPVVFDKSIQQSQVAEFEVKFKELFDSEDIDTVGLDFEHPVQQLQTKSGKANFTRLYKEALARGYNLQDAELRMGQESIVFLTKNRAIKFSAEDLSLNEIPGLTTVSEFKMKRGDLYMSVSERVKTLTEGEFQAIAFENKIPDVDTALRDFGQRTGIDVVDSHSGNFGINSKGELVFLDTGGIAAHFEPNPNHKFETKLGAQFFKQVEANKHFNPRVTDADVQKEMQRRTKNLIAKKRRQYKAEQKKLDLDPQIPQARATTLLGGPIRETAEPSVILNKEKLAEHTAELKEYDFGAQDLGELFTEGLTFEEARFVQEQTQYLEHVSKMKKALEKGINCISKKQI